MEINSITDSYLQKIRRRIHYTQAQVAPSLCLLGGDMLAKKQKRIGNWSMSSLNYAQELLEKYHDMRRQLENEREDIAYSMLPNSMKHAGQITGYVTSRGVPNDVVFNAANVLVEDRSIVQLIITVSAIDRTLAALDDEMKKFVEEYFWKNKREHTLEEKRKRRIVLSLVCHHSGIIQAK